MLFNSLEFALFLPIVFALYWFVCNRNLRLQNALLLAASYFFYGWWDWRFLSLIIFSSFVDYIVGLQLGKQEDDRIRWRLLLVSVIVNLGFLGVFKYYDFFAQSFVDAFTLVGVPFDIARLNWILPVGISFYTFQTLSYSLDIYNRELEPTKDIVSFFAFVSFFPQLVAGPIERASHLLPQFDKKRNFTYDNAVDGLRQMLWGFFKKVVIADNCALYVTNIFANYEDLSGITLVMGAVYLIFQIYCDFSGYSDIAIGTARLFGFNLTQNFNNPYFSTSTTELWRRWHMSLSTWFRDYVFTPLMLRYRHLKKKTAYIATFITFVLLGIWHGANWTFVVFGLLQSIALCLEIYTRKRRKKLKKSKNFYSKPYYFGSWLLTMVFWLTVSILFRAEDLGHAWDYIVHIVTNPDWVSIAYLDLILIGLIGLLMIIERIQFEKPHGLVLDGLIKPKIIRWGVYLILVLSVLILGGPQQEFVYFQF